jgi:glyoxylase-like metal-dependent hydrolase (beta-lactamase superfamily II)
MTIDRRSFIAGIATGAAALTLGPAANANEPGMKQYTIGNAKITAIHDGSMQRPVAEGFIRNATVAELQTLLKEAGLPTDTLTGSFTAMLIETGGKKILVDTLTNGVFNPAVNGLETNLAAAGIALGDIDTVLISHFHPDHINGLALKDGKSRFPKAEIRVNEAEWAFWMDDQRMAAAPEGMQGVFKAAMGLFDGVKAQVRPFKAEETVAPGIVAVAAYGHTPGHTCFAIDTGAEPVYFMADTTNDPRIFARRPDWQIMFDMDADMAVTTRKALLDRLAADKARALFYHAPFPALGTIAKAGAGYDFALLS